MADLPDLSNDHVEGKKQNFILVSRIGSGAFGALYEGRMSSSGFKVAIKVEHREANFAQLSFEYDKYKSLGCKRGVFGFPRLYYFAPLKGHPDCQALVMTLLGQSLIHLFKELGPLSRPTMLQVALQMISRFKYFHGCGFIHRDIKPDNFMIGRQEEGTERVIHLIDMGLSKRYIDEATGEHIAGGRTDVKMGTERYFSRNIHLGEVPSRRDDLEAVAYVLAFLGKGYLPWSGSQAKPKPGEAKSAFTGRLKRECLPEEIFRGMEDAFPTFLKLVKALDFSQEPEYDRYMELFQRSLYFRYPSFIDVYDWAPKARPV